MPDGTKEAVAQAPVTPDGEPKIVDTNWEIEARKAFKDRDAARERLKELEAKAEAERQQQIEEQKLYKQELERVKPEYESLKAFKDAHDKRIQDQLAESEKALTGEAKSEYDRFIAKLDAESRIEWIKAHGAKAPPANSPAATRPTQGKSPLDIKGMTMEDRLKLFREDPEAFKKLVGNG